MKAAQLIKYGSNESVALNDVPRPEVFEGKVLVEVQAAGVNPIDWKIRSGYLEKVLSFPFPFTLGLDFSGIVVETGPGVSELKTGQEVFGQAGVVNRGSGSFAEFALADARFIARKPRRLSQMAAGASALAGVSALQALTEHIDLRKGQHILIHGGSGGIGVFAIQIAKHIGAYVATTARKDSFEFVRSFGADEAIDYENQKFEEILNNYDAVFDMVGGDTYIRSFKVLKKGGIVVTMMEQPDEERMKEFGVQAVGQFTKVTTERLDRLAELFDAGVIKIHIDQVFPLAEAAQALTYLETGHPKGKVVINMK